MSVFCNLIGRSFSHHVGFKKGREAGLTLEGEVVACEGRLRFLVGQKRSSSSLVILKSRLMLPAYFCRAIYENIDIVVIEFYGILKVTFSKSNPFRFKETLISFNIK